MFEDILKTLINQQINKKPTYNNYKNTSFDSFNIKPDYDTKKYEYKSPLTGETKKLPVLSTFNNIGKPYEGKNKKTYDKKIDKNIDKKLKKLDKKFEKMDKKIKKNKKDKDNEKCFIM